MDAILELVLTIIVQPFEGIYENTFAKVNKIPSQGMRILLRILLVAVPLLLIFGIYCLCSYLISGHWI